MNYAYIRKNDVANGEGVRVSLFVSGCNKHCPGCFNEEQQSFSYGKEFTEKQCREIMEEILKPHVAGLSILGGDPLDQSDADKRYLSRLISAVHLVGKTVWLWTGTKWKDIWIRDEADGGYLAPRDATQWLVMASDVLVDGPFIEALYDPSLVWRGSSNQRVIDVKATLSVMPTDPQTVILWDSNK